MSGGRTYEIGGTMLPIPYGETWAGISAALFGASRRRSAAEPGEDPRTEKAPANEAAAQPMTFARVDAAGGTTLRIGGALDVHSAPELRRFFDEVVAARPERVILELDALTMLDSSGVGAIVGLFKRVRAAGGHVSVQGVTGQPLAVCKLLKLDRVFGI